MIDDDNVGRSAQTRQDNISKYETTLLVSTDKIFVNIYMPTEKNIFRYQRITFNIYMMYIKCVDKCRYINT